MKYRDIIHPNLNNDKKTRVYFTVHEKEFDVFFREIYDEEHYKKGLEYLKKGWTVTGGGWKNDEKHLVSWSFPKEATLVDLGANVGLATLYFAPFVKKIYAFEPSPPVFEALKKNTKHLDNVEIFNEGVTAITQRIPMISESSGSPPQKTWDGSSQIAQSVMAQFYDIKTLFERHNIGHVDLLKIDIENNEHEVFPSFEFGEVSKDIDAIIGEGHIVSTPDRKGLYAVPAFIPLMLDEWGYETKFIESPKPYFEWIQTYTDFKTKQTKTYKLPLDAIFFAKKK